jgi:hypothetical protein
VIGDKLCLWLWTVVSCKTVCEEETSSFKLRASKQRTEGES